MLEPCAHPAEPTVRAKLRQALFLAPLCLLLGATPNVVLITADTLRADHLGSYGYFRDTSPVIDALAADGLLIEHCIAPMSTTLPSHTSLMTSSYPAAHGILSNLQFYDRPVETGDGLRTAAQLLRAEGYSTAAFTSSSPLSEASGIDAGFDTFVGPPPYDQGEERVDLPAERTTERALTWLAQAQAPFFLWLHYFDPHSPYDPPEPFRDRYQPEPRLAERLERLGVPPKRREQATRVTNRYDGEIRYMDGQIGRILEALRARDLYSDALIVLTSDHGEGLWQHDYLQHGIVWAEQLHVPLIFKFPASAAAARGRRAVVASLIDVLPTMVAGARLPLPSESFHGIDLLGSSRRYALSQREYRKNHWDEPVYTLTGSEWKYHDHGNAGGRLFQLSRDPHELVNVLGRHPQMAQRMRAELRAMLAESRRKAKSLHQKLEIPEAAREQLRALGYLDGEPDPAP
jgi:arylsulfatase A-like enzyme